MVSSDKNNIIVNLASIINIVKPIGAPNVNTKDIFKSVIHLSLVSLKKSGFFFLKLNHRMVEINIIE